MLFNSAQFLFFFIAVVVLYFSIPHRYRWVLLLISSYFFYMCWNWRYIALIIISTVIDYFCGRKMGVLPHRKQRLKYLLLSLFSNLGLLFIFKYFNFFASSFNHTFHVFNASLTVPYLNFLLPVGISFYTFQTLSYSIDVYRGKILPEKHFGIFALYVSFFPQLVAGPIERASNLLPQFLRKKVFDEERVTSGLRLMLWGLFKKIVVANRLAIYVDAVYGNAEYHSAFTLLTATYFFAFQIYCDFSGYSDIAIGVARVLGFDLMKNFERPYFARSIPEFWGRWHISLSTWFRDYMYFPLGGNRKGASRTIINLMVVFLVSGMWHGANWTFLIWGGLHGVYTLFFKLFSNRPKPFNKPASKIAKLVQITLTFHLVCFAWIFFRADSLSHAGLVLSRIFSNQWANLFIPALDQFTYGLLSLFILLSVDLLHENSFLPWFGTKLPQPIRWLAYIGLIVILFLTGVFNESQFIYFQF